MSANHHFPVSVYIAGMLLLALASVTHASPSAERALTFESRGVTLAGTLVMPTDAPTAAVIFVHGSGKQPRSLSVANAFARHGIAALVYDKRGVGESGGEFEGNQSASGTNLELLAADAAAALRALRGALAPDIPVGYAGISQAGWIAPMAAQTEGADFLLMWSGPVCKVSEEDIFSKYTADKDVRWVPRYAEALAARTRPYVWPDFLGRDTDSAEDLAALDIPGLWLFGSQDGSVPVDLSIEKLEALQQAGHAYDYVVFSETGHNNMSETFATAVDWVRRRINQP
ncbi:MAG: alpha/beta hydrolase [Pseudomonadota bacterium]